MKVAAIATTFFAVAAFALLSLYFTLGIALAHAQMSLI